jgi:hypothetical protein
MPALLDPNLQAYRTGMLDLSRKRFDASQANAAAEEEDRKARRELNLLNSEVQRENLRNLMEQRTTATKTKADEEKAKRQAVRGFRIAGVLDMLASGGNPSELYDRYPDEVHAIVKNHPNWLEMKPEEFTASAGRLRKKMAFEAAPIEGIKNMLSTERGLLLKGDKEGDKIDVASATANISDMVRQTGANLKPSEIANLGKVASRNPALLDSLQGELEKEVAYQKESARAKGLLAGAEKWPWDKVPQGGWFSEPQVVGLTGYDEKNNPMLQNMTREDAKKQGAGIVSRSAGGIMLDGKPVQAPKAMGPLLQRLQPKAKAASTGEIVERRLKDGSTVRVQRMPDGTWAEVE